MIWFVLYTKCSKHFPGAENEGIFVMEFDSLAINPQTMIEDFIETYPHYTAIALFPPHKEVLPHMKDIDPSVKLDFVTPVVTQTTTYKVESTMPQVDPKYIKWPSFGDDLEMWN